MKLITVRTMMGFAIALPILRLSFYVGRVSDSVTRHP